MDRKHTKSDVGVVIGRFQVAELHEAHIDLIETVRKEHPKVLLFLGLSPAIGTRNNPLDLECRRQMIQEKYPDILVSYIKDVPTDEIWSKNLDRMISDHVLPGQTVMLFGSRDSFITHYKGKYPVQELTPDRIISGTELRNRISKKAKNSKEFREGVIWSVYNQYPRVFTTVDVAMINFKENQLLLGRKENEAQYRFIGGFADPRSTSFEADALRELYEETTLGCDQNCLRYIGSTFIDDWRYRGEVDKIKTLFYIAPYTYGCPQASDDIAEVRWFKLNRLYVQDIMDVHIPLYKMLQKHLIKEYNTCPDLQLPGNMPNISNPINLD